MKFRNVSSIKRIKYIESNNFVNGSNTRNKENLSNRGLVK